MSWFGGWFGGGSSGGGSEVEDPPTPVPVPVVHGDLTYFDHVAHALDRLAQQFRSAAE